MRVVGVWILLAIGYFIAMPYIFDSVILAPCHDGFITYELMRDVACWMGADRDVLGEFHVTLININLTAPLFIHISTAFMLSIVTAMPYLLFEVWRFVAPALYDKEQRGVKRAFLSGTFMFYLGAAMGYFIIYPLALRFLATYQLSSEIASSLAINSYIDNFVIMIISMGLAFELPILLWLLSLMGIINRAMLIEYRKLAFVVIVIVAAIITPTTDPFTLAIVTLPLYFLYELSLAVVKR